MDKAAPLPVKQFVSFTISGELFGIDIKLLNEVNPNVNIIPIPLSAAYIRGHVNIRGQVVLVIDLAVMFGRPPRPIMSTSHIMIFKTTQDFLRLQTSGLITDQAWEAFGDKPVAIIVDLIGDVISVNPQAIETPTNNINDDYARFVDGIIKLEEELLIIINPVRILNHKQGEVT